jgi:hypothetical protein
MAVRHRELLGRRNDVDLIRLHLGLGIDLDHGHVGGALEKFRQRAGVVGRKMQDDDEGGPGIDGRLGEEGLQGGNAARRSAQTYDRQSVRFTDRTKTIIFKLRILF